MASPYDAADDYRAAGWLGTVILPRRKKSPPPTGFTGYDGTDPDDAQVAAWRRRGGNIGLRLPSDVIGLDVDAYDDKHGGKVLAEAEARLGKLPPTWRSTSRDTDFVSGIRYYRVPPGRRWANVLGEHVELIHHGHRFAVAPPSVHPAGGEYGWWDPDGLPTHDIPTVAELASLPDAWVAELDRGDAADHDRKAEVDRADVDAWVAELPDEDVHPAVGEVLANAAMALSVAASRHDTTATLMLDLVRKGEQGLVGVPTALDTLEAMFTTALGGERDAQGEWSRLLVGAYGIVKANPTPTAAEVFDDLADDLFDATPVLRRIRDAAHSRLVGSQALLCYVLARVLAELPPGVALPPVVGGRASLNLGVAVVGGSGAGKSALLAVSRDLLGDVGQWQEDIERNVGSGEGLVQTFLRKGSGRDLVLIDYPHRILTVDEIDSLGATQRRSGATIAPTIRSALTGGTLGQANASAERNRHVRANSYRLVMLLGVQPTRSAALLDDADAGTPQRLVWVQAVDPSLPDADVPWPGALDWHPPADLPEVIDYPEHVRAEVRAARRAQLRDAGADPLAGHKLLTRLKVAAALALLHGEVAINDQWWELAGVVIDMSAAVQVQCKRTLSTQHQEGHDAVAVTKARAEDAADEDRVKRAAQAITKTLQTAGGEWVVWDKVRPRITLRPYADEAVDRLVASGTVEVEHYTSPKGVESRRLRHAGG
ncbi:bifunctional DNA primase/polymerase [Nocardioides sp. zg-DK7169]|uniref:bifunctional DNA primase/polymerase n=1 Tax=Nocardioides sp. zg-DK7169 TaxID=2736600 RepID=UPI001552DAE4|nr:bifunctional DNA primase/polymerase [Nocardioides sp. zg-DK7169]